MNKRNVGLTPHFHPENIPFAELCQDLRQIRHALRRAPIRTGAFQIPRLHAELPRRVVVVLQRITHHQNRRRLNPQRLAGMAINAFLRFPVAHDERPRTGVPGRRGAASKVVRRMVSPDWRRWPISGCAV